MVCIFGCGLVRCLNNDWWCSGVIRLVRILRWIVRLLVWFLLFLVCCVVFSV